MDGIISKEEFLPLAGRFITKPEPITPSLPPSSLGSSEASFKKFYASTLKGGVNKEKSSGSMLNTVSYSSLPSMAEEQHREKNQAQKALKEAEDFNALLDAELAEMKERAKKEKERALEKSKEKEEKASQAKEEQRPSVDQEADGEGVAEPEKSVVPGDPKEKKKEDDLQVRDFRRFWGTRVGAR